MVQEYGFMTRELERSVDEMCNLSTVIEEKSIEKGIIALVNTLKDLKQSNDYIIEVIVKRFGLSEVEAQKYV